MLLIIIVFTLSHARILEFVLSLGSGWNCMISECEPAPLDAGNGDAQLQLALRLSAAEARGFAAAHEAHNVRGQGFACELPTCAQAATWRIACDACDARYRLESDNFFFYIFVSDQELVCEFFLFLTESFFRFLCLILCHSYMCDECNSSSHSV
jgi:hypothetical protein